jgi:hypothetical protein
MLPVPVSVRFSTAPATWAALLRLRVTVDTMVSVPLLPVTLSLTKSPPLFTT